MWKIQVFSNQFLLKAGNCEGKKGLAVRLRMTFVSRPVAHCSNHVMNYTPHLVAQMLHVTLIHALECSIKNKWVWMTSSFPPVEFKGLMHENVDGVFARKPEKKKQPFKLDHKCVSAWIPHLILCIKGIMCLCRMKQFPVFLCRPFPLLSAL